MANNKIDLSRRKLLAGLGMAGVASAGAGLGTSAFFSDEESFVENTINAGELDLLLDYRATYAGGPGRLEEIDNIYSDQGPGVPFDVVEEEEGVYLIGEVPTPDEEENWEDAVQDGDDDSIGPDFCGPDSPLINGDDIPVFTLQDVKPGDWGEVTVSLHLCDNPGWMWMNGELTENAENGVAEPEAEVDETDGDPGEGEGELADAIQTRIWYDENCNNVHDGEESEGGGPLCVQLVLDESGSIVLNGFEDDVEDGANALASDLLEANDDNRVGVTTFQDSGAGDVQNSVADEFEDATINSVSGQDTFAGEGIELATDDLVNNCPEDHDKIMVVFTDGSFNDPSTAESEAQEAREEHGIEIFAIGVSGADEDQLEDIASEPVEDHVFIGTGEETIGQLFSQVSETITEGEEVILEGSLAEVMDALENGVDLDGNRGSEEREPFAPGMTQCIGFEWELPLETGNEVQTDSVGFDLGFYTEQRRNNPEPENPFAT